MNKCYIPRPATERICIYCRNRFFYKGGKKKYCSNVCKEKDLPNFYKKNAEKYNPERKILKKCSWCGREFEIIKGTKLESGRRKGMGYKYCSSSCRQLYGWRAKHKRICVVCGKEFLAHRNDTKTCSGNCKNKIGGIGLKIRTCECCRVKFSPNQPHQIFCSSYCRRKAGSQKNLHSRLVAEMIARKTNPTFLLNSRTRRDIYYSLKKAKSDKNGRRWKDLVGYSADDLRRNLEKQFKDGMSWDEFLAGKIHIDHKIPLSAFNFTSSEDLDFKRAWALKNLQPFRKKDNLEKHSKLNQPFQPALAIKIRRSPWEETKSLLKRKN